jgi:hypothetical protein
VSARRWVRAAAIAVPLVLVAGCGDDEDASPDAADPSADAAGGSSAASPDDDGGSGRDGFSCPLSAEEVGDVLGASVDKDDTTCTYAPSGGELPSAGFMAQLVDLCDQGFPEANGYTEPVGGIGADAFLKTDGAATAELWVCAPDAFLVWVDTGDSDPSTAIAQVGELASQAVAAG